MSYFAVRPGSVFRVGKIFKSNSTNPPFWTFYLNCYETTPMGKKFYGTVNVVCYERQTVKEGDWVVINELQEYRCANERNRSGGMSQYNSLVCSLSKYTKKGGSDDGVAEGID